MTEQTTAPASQDEMAGRNALMRAFATAEQISSTLPVLPADIGIKTDYRGGFELDLHFYDHPEAVVEFAAAHSVEAQVSPHPDAAGAMTKTLTSVSVTTDSGVKARAWALADAESVAVAA